MEIGEYIMLEDLPLRVRLRMSGNFTDKRNINTWGILDSGRM